MCYVVVDTCTLLRVAAAAATAAAPAVTPADHLDDVEAGSPLESEIIAHYRNAFLDKKFESVWKVAKIQLILNEKLSQEYDG